MDNETAVLQLLQARGLGAKTLARILMQLTEERREVSDLSEASEAELTHHYGLKPEIAESVKASYEHAVRLSETLHEREVSLLTLGSPTYPAQLVDVLKDTAPPVLFAHGNLRILDDKAVGFCGSRHASERGLQVAASCARMLAERGVNIVSGYAHGVDLAAHRTALECGGTTTLVLAEGILHFRPKAEVAEFLTERNFVALSEFPPRLGWIARNAMHRNRTICALSSAVIVVEAGTTGGTLSAGETALELGRPLFVVEYAKPESSAEGNAILLNRGGKALRGDREGKPNLAQVFEALDVPGSVQQPRSAEEQTQPRDHTPPVEAAARAWVTAAPTTIQVPVKRPERKSRARRSRDMGAQARLPLDSVVDSALDSTPGPQPQTGALGIHEARQIVPPILFSVGNHHSPQAGEPPRITDEGANQYHGYFENGHGEQVIFIYDRVTKEACLFTGDAGWEKTFKVRNGRVAGMQMNETEQLWLTACWRAATEYERQSPPPTAAS